jgi:putative transposase
MPDHGHGLIGTGYPLTLSRVVQDVKWISAGALNRSRGVTGSVWPHPFGDRLVRPAKELNDRLVSMHLNPVRKGRVAKPEPWRWSSYNNLALDKEIVADCPIQMDNAQRSESYRG